MKLKIELYRYGTLVFGKVLGVPQNSYFFWVSGGLAGAPELMEGDGMDDQLKKLSVSAFTAEELALWADPDAIYRNVNGQGKWMASIPSVEGYGETMAEALGNLLIKRIHDGLDPKTL